MLPPHRRQRKTRALRLEAMEPRWFLSATPALSTYDFTLDDFVESVSVDPLISSADVGKMIGLDQVAADYGFTGSGQTVALIDTGIAYDHLALSDGFGTGHRVVGGYDFAENDADPYDDGSSGSHGTHVAGIISSTDARAVGIAPGADIVALRVFNDQGSGLFSWIEQALQWVHEHRNDFEYPITTVNLSLGTAYNGESVPAWAMLEDEFAQLVSDDIFISVAAGNSFASYQTAGLSYPAVSPSVVPVSSVDASGNLSYFSQRDDRAIAAPGRSILSTVPDYRGNRNGVADDFASYSGTSMAAPLVAGASMLLREAFEFAGVTGVNEQMLYSTMLAAADMVYDAVTGAYYHRLNIERAIDSIIPADDYGSTASAAASLGTVVDTLSLNGTINKLDDSDWFSFKAGASGTLTLSFDASAELLPQWELASMPADVKIDGATVTFTVVAGQTYTVGLSTNQLLAHYSLDVNLKAVPEAAPQCSVVQVGREVRILGTAGDNNFSLIVADVYHLTVNGVQYQFDSRAVNSFVIDGGGGRDTIEIQANRGSVMAYLQPSTLDLSGSGYKIHTADVEYAAIRANLGLSRAIFYDSPGNDTFAASPTSAELSGPGYVNRVEGFSSVYAYASLGIDVAWLYDSPGNDILSMNRADTTLSGRGFSNRVRYFDEVHADSKAGGYDIAMLYDFYGDMQLRGSGNKALVSYKRSTASDSLSQGLAADGTSDQTASASLVGFKRLRAISYGGKLLRPQVVAIDFILELIGRRT